MTKITISGLPGSGKTTAARIISEKLKIPFLSMGEIHGLVAKEMGITINKLMELAKTDSRIHYEADKKTIEIGKTEKDFVIEAWIAYYFIPKSFKIFLHAKEKSTVGRIRKTNRPDEPIPKSEKETREQIKRRLRDTDEGFKKAYGISFMDKTNYNLVIDTTNIQPNDVVEIILTVLKNIKKFKQKTFSNNMYDIFQKEKAPSEKPNEIVEVDFREKNSLVPSELIRQNLTVEFKELKVADYIVKDTAIERKTAPDFFASVFDKRIFSQLKELNQYEKKLLIVEGDLSGKNSLHPNALKGLLLSITLNYNIPIIFTKGPEETAQYIKLIANKKTKETSINPKKKNLSPNEELQFILEGFPGIGPTKAKRLLEKFETLKKIFSTPEKNLKTILGKNSSEFVGIIKRKYLKD